MATQQLPPYSKSVYLLPAALESQQVAEAESAVAKSDLDTGYKSPVDPKLQRWFIDPSILDQNQFFVHLDSDFALVLESPEEDGGNCFINTQGDRYLNGGIQVWIFESVGDPSAGFWRLRNFKTNFYVYLNYNGQGPAPTGLPIVARLNPQCGDSNANWGVSVAAE